MGWEVGAKFKEGDLSRCLSCNIKEKNHFISSQPSASNLTGSNILRSLNFHVFMLSLIKSPFGQVVKIPLIVLPSKRRVLQEDLRFPLTSVLLFTK